MVCAQLIEGESGGSDETVTTELIMARGLIIHEENTKEITTVSVVLYRVSQKHLKGLK